MSGPDRIFTRQKRKVLRRRITSSEAVFGGVFVLVLVLSGFWVMAQKDNFDPSDRDISFETLAKDSTGEELYETPLKRWAEPGTEPAGLAAPPDLGILPAGRVPEGWILDGRVEEYDVDNVYEKINGAAEQYIAFGFRRLHYATFEQGDDSLTVEIYDQGTFPNVLGVFAAQGGTRREILSRGDVFYYATGIGAIGGYANYYFKIAGNRASETVQSGSEGLIDAIGAIPASGGATPRPYRILREGLGLGFGDLAYERVDVFQYDFLGDVWFGAVAPGAEARYFLHEAADPEAAAATFRRLRDEQAYEYEILDATDRRAVMKHRYLGTFFTLEHDGGLILGVDAAASRADAEAAIVRLREASRGRQADPEA